MSDPTWPIGALILFGSVVAFTAGLLIFIEERAQQREPDANASGTGLARILTLFYACSCAVLRGSPCRIVLRFCPNNPENPLPYNAIAW